MRKLSLYVIGAAILFNSCNTTAESNETGEPQERAYQLTIESDQTFQTEEFDKDSVKIVGYDKINGRVLFVDGKEDGLTILSHEEEKWEKVKTITFEKGEVNSVAVYENLAAVAVTDSSKTKDGQVYFVDPGKGAILGSVTVGPLPDMVAFTPDGKYLLSANEGEPSKKYNSDPEGTVSIIELNRQDLSNSKVTNLGFDESLITTGPSGEFPRTHSYLENFLDEYSVARDIEPEYLAIDGNSRFAYVVCQENNSIAKIDIEKKEVLNLKSLGYKDFSQSGIDIIKDGSAQIIPQPVYGMYMPDAITTFEINGKTYLATANEGDDRGDWEDKTDFEDQDICKAKKLTEDFGIILDSRFLDDEGKILDEYKNLRVSPHDCIDSNGDGAIDILTIFGGRSFSIWDEDLNLIYDSGSLFEEYTAQYAAGYFNCNDNNLVMDDRSTKKGPEPESITYGEVDGVPMLFVALECFGGFFAFDVSTPSSPKMLLYHSDRNFKAKVDKDFKYTDESYGNTGDLGPEGLIFIPAEESLSGQDQLIVGNQVSGTLRMYNLSM
ncbi:MAG: choice-of-anchor I family protein [Spirochaetales bacterium]|nr:choice-of-anchor I family protein [Spirochaetales bacterium]